MSALQGVWIKVNRAKKHFHELDAEVKAFKGRDPYLCVIDVNPQTGESTYYLKIVEHIPAEWGAILGDCIHNLRSSLDGLAYALVLANSGTPTKHTKFPIGADRGNFAALAGASPAAIKVFSRFKTHKGGNSTFNRLNDICVIDKHRLLMPVGAVHQSYEMSTVVTFGSDEPLKVSGTIPVGKARFPVKDGDILGRTSNTGAASWSAETGYASGLPADMKMESNFKPLLQVAFGEGQVFDGEPLVPTLKQLIDFVERVVQIFEKKFFP